MIPYTSLVEQVLDNTILKENINTWAESKEYLNLIDSKWKEKLENNAIYKKLLTNAEDCFERVQSKSTKYIIDNMENYFPILVIGSCRFMRTNDQFENSKSNRKAPIPVFIQDSEPLTEIIKVMHSDLNRDIVIRFDGKFRFTACQSTIYCTKCNDAQKEINSHGIVVDTNNQPCPKITNIFTGDSVKGTFSSMLQNIFPDTFLALLKLNITYRYCFNDQVSNNVKTYRIAGTVVQMIAFDHNKLSLKKERKIHNDGEQSVSKEAFIFDDDTILTTINGENKPTDIDLLFSEDENQVVTPHFPSTSNSSSSKKRQTYSDEDSLNLLEDATDIYSSVKRFKSDSKADFMSELEEGNSNTSNERQPQQPKDCMRKHSLENKEKPIDQRSQIMHDPVMKRFIEDDDDIIEAYPNTCKKPRQLDMNTERSWKTII